MSMQFSELSWNENCFGVVMLIGSGKTYLSKKYDFILDLESVVSDDSKEVLDRIRPNSNSSDMEWKCFNMMYRSFCYYGLASLKDEIKRYKIVMAHNEADLNALGLLCKSIVIPKNGNYNNTIGFTLSRLDLQKRHLTDLMSYCTSYDLKPVACETVFEVEKYILSLV